MPQPPLVALDIGSTKVACIVALPTGGPSSYEILGSSLLAYPPGAATWPEDPLAVGRTIEEALEVTGVARECLKAQVTTSHPAIRSETVRATITLADEPIAVRQRDLERLTRVALDHALSVDREALTVERLGCSGNGFKGVPDPRGLPATRLVGTFHVVTVPTAVRRAIVQAVESAGLDVSGITYSLQADVVASEEARQPQCLLLLDLGGLNVDVGYFEGGRLEASQVVCWGGLTLAHAIATTLHLTLDQALPLSMEGLASRRAEVTLLLTERLEELRQAIQDVLADRPLPDRVIVTGRGALMDGLVEWVERVTGVPTLLGRSHRIQAMGNLARQIGLSTALGLLELVTAGSAPSKNHPPARLFDRLLVRTKSLLTEYF